jgi:gliding motility-associated-like protein
VDTVKGLCGGTLYEFSAYITNVIKTTTCGANPIEPDLSFSIETLSGTIITTYNTGKIPAKAIPAWNQFGTFISTPSGVSGLVLRITNNAPGGCGNDLALDDIAFRPCGPKIEAGISGITITDTALCEGDTDIFTLNATYSAGYTNPQVQWQESKDDGRSWADITGATSTTYIRQPTLRGLYKYRIIIGEGNNINLVQCRIASNPITILVSAPAIIQTSNFVSGCSGSNLILTATGGTAYEWTGPNGFYSVLQSPEIQNLQFTNAGRYIVKGTTINGCVNFDTADVVVNPGVVASINAGPFSICEGKEIRLSSSGGTRYKWVPSSSLNNDTIPDPLARPKDSTRYTVLVSNVYQCTDTASVFVNVNKLPVANAGPDIKMLKGKSAQIMATVKGTDINFTWLPTTNMSNPNSVRPIVNPITDQVYRLEVNSNLGCGSSSDEVLVQVFETVKVPNTFTPNGDGINDKWEINLLNKYENCLLEVYNTAGQLVYRTVGYNNPWDGTRNGTPLPAGTYYFAIDLKFQDLPKLSGYITIIR